MAIVSVPAGMAFCLPIASPATLVVIVHVSPRDLIIITVLQRIPEFWFTRTDSGSRNRSCPNWWNSRNTQSLARWSTPQA